MIGHKDLAIKVPSDSPPKLLSAMNQAAEKLGHQERFQTSSGQILDDHYFLNQVGIPTIDIIGDFTAKSWWHTPKDNIDLISADSLAITKSVVDEMLANLIK